MRVGEFRTKALRRGRGGKGGALARGLARGEGDGRPRRRGGRDRDVDEFEAEIRSKLGNLPKLRLRQIHFAAVDGISGAVEIPVLLETEH